jgi:hypothetical protein
MANYCRAVIKSPRGTNMLAAFRIVIGAENNDSKKHGLLSLSHHATRSDKVSGDKKNKSAVINDLGGSHSK